MSQSGKDKRDDKDKLDRPSESKGCMVLVKAALSIKNALHCIVGGRKRAVKKVERERAPASLRCLSYKAIGRTVSC